MVKRFFSLITKEYGGVHEAAILLGFFSLVSQLLGLVRDRALVGQLGPSLELDVYYAAFRIPDIIFTSLASLVAVTAIIPFITEKLVLQNGEEEARRFMDRVFSSFMIVMLVVCGIIFVTMPFCVRFIAPGFSPDGQILLVAMSRIMLLSPIFLGIQNLLGSIVQMYKKFFIYALAPVFYNLGILVGVFVLYPWFGIYGLAYGVVLGALLHLAVQLPSVHELRFIPRFTFDFRFTELLRIVRIALPRTLTIAMNTFLIAFLTAIASHLQTGSISILTFALNLQSVPIMMISVSYAVASFPSLVDLYTRNKIDEFVGTVLSTIRQIIFWSLPITALFIILRAHIVRVVYGTHSLSWNDTRLTAALFAVTALAVIAHSLSLIYVRAYYASGKTAKPFIITVIGALATCGMAYFLLSISKSGDIQNMYEGLLRLGGIENTDIILLGIAYTFGHFVNVFLFSLLFRRDFGTHVLSPVLKTLVVGIISSVALGVTTYGILNFMSPIISGSTFFGILIQGIIAGGGGIIVAVGVLWFFKSQELLGFIDALQSKFWKREVLIPGQENFE